jgi:two-component system sensor histidine kinase KdpD
VVIEQRPQADIVQAAAAALNRIFRAPAVIFVERDGALRPAAAAGGATVTDAEHEAAQGALAARLAARAEVYPYDQSRFDFWPVATRSGGGCVVGVDFTRADQGRPPSPERFVEVVLAYLAIAFGAPAKSRPAP